MKLLSAVLLSSLLVAMPANAGSITDSRGSHDFETAPERVVALSWSMVEQLVEMGMTPVGAADVEGYETWVGRPALPADVVSVGLRNEPNVELIAELEPDLILVSDDQISFADRLETVAPVLHFDTFSADHDNQAESRRVFLALAELLDREQAAAESLTELDAELASLKAMVDDRFDGSPPRVTVVRFTDKARLVVHGRNSMPHFALRALGVENAMPLPPTDWGISYRKTQDLGAIEDGHVFHIEPFPQGKELFAEPLWQAMPFIRAGRFHAVPSTWTYGGVHSVGYLASAFVDVLMEIEPE